MTPSAPSPAADRSGRAPIRLLVLMATRNGSPWIVEQIDSILAQQGVDVALRIADDASSDGTPDLVETCYAADRRVRLHRRATPTGSASANFLALISEREARGFDGVAFADQDDIWHPDKLARACTALAQADAAGYSSSVQVGFEASAPVQRQRSTPTVADFLFEGAGQGCTFVLRATFYERVRGFVREHPDALRGFHFHDWLIYLLARAWELRWRFDPEPSMRYRQHESNDIGARGGWPSVTRRWRRIADGWYRAQILQAARLYELAGGASPGAARMIELLRSKPGFTRRLAFSGLTLLRSRRRHADRLVVAAAALAGLL